jgi:antitoxin Phd
MTRWQVQEAKARFSEFLDAALKTGPQVITRRGIEEAVLLPIDEWQRLRHSAQPSLKQLLLGPSPRFDLRIPERSKWGRRPPVKFE